MFFKWTCGSGDAAADSVSVDATALEMRRQEEQEEHEREERERAQHELAEERRRQAEEARREKEEQKRREEEAERLRRAEEAEHLQREEEQRAEEDRLRREEQLRLEREARQEALGFFYARNGFTGANTPRRGGCSVVRAATTYPLHCAAELGDEQVAAMLLKEGAESGQKDSSGRTAAQIAQRKNKGGSHEGVLRVLGGAVGSPGAGGA